VQLWDVATTGHDEPEGSFTGHTKAVFGCAITLGKESGRYLLVSCSHDKSARVWHFKATDSGLGLATSTNTPRPIAYKDQKRRGGAKA